MFREMWDLINVNDSDKLTADQLETGIATVTRSDDFFDCHPAIQTAFRCSINTNVIVIIKIILRFTKIIACKGVVVQDNKGDIKVGGGISFEEFKDFLNLLRQYYIYCQVVTAIPTRISQYQLISRCFLTMS